MINRIQDFAQTTSHKNRSVNFAPGPKDRIKKTVEDTGAHVTDENPLVWLSLEFEGDGDPKLRLQTWPGVESRILATADPHVYAVNWIN